MIIMKKTTIILIGLILILLFASCSGKPMVSRPDNLYEYAFKVENDTLMPRSVEFFWTPEQVLEAINLSQDAQEEYFDGKSSRILHTIPIKGLSDDVREVFMFNSDRLMSIQYHIYFDPDQYTTVIDTLKQQGEAFLPESWQLIVNNPYKEDTYWVDSEGNQLTFHPAFESVGSLEKCVLFTFGVSKEKAREYLEGTK